MHPDHHAFTNAASVSESGAVVDRRKNDRNTTLQNNNNNHRQKPFRTLFCRGLNSKSINALFILVSLVVLVSLATAQRQQFAVGQNGQRVVVNPNLRANPSGSPLLNQQSRILRTASGEKLRLPPGFKLQPNKAVILQKPDGTRMVVYANENGQVTSARNAGRGPVRGRGATGSSAAAGGPLVAGSQQQSTNRGGIRRPGDRVSPAAGAKQSRPSVVVRKVVGGQQQAGGPQVVVRPVSGSLQQSRSVVKRIRVTKPPTPTRASISQQQPTRLPATRQRNGGSASVQRQSVIQQQPAPVRQSPASDRNPFAGLPNGQDPQAIFGGLGPGGFPVGGGGGLDFQNPTGLLTRNPTPLSQAQREKFFGQRERRKPHSQNFCDFRSWTDETLFQNQLQRVEHFVGNTSCSEYFFECAIGQTFVTKCRGSQVFDVQTGNCNYRRNVRNCPGYDHVLHCTIKETCSNDEFACCAETQKCIPFTKRCDGVPDCSDGEDENNCPACISDQFPCVKSGKCIPWEKKCDGVPNDCFDDTNLDEQQCGNCAQSEFHCSRSDGAFGPICLDLGMRCNGAKDCPYGEDELNCRTKGPKDLLCEDQRKRIPKILWCDGNDDCDDGSDEFYCNIHKQWSG